MLKVIEGGDQDGSYAQKLRAVGEPIRLDELHMNELITQLRDNESPNNKGTALPNNLFPSANLPPKKNLAKARMGREI